jgi:hypothetical protein
MQDAEGTTKTKVVADWRDEEKGNKKRWAKVKLTEGIKKGKHKLHEVKCDSANLFISDRCEMILICEKRMCLLFFFMQGREELQGRGTT